MTSIENMIVKLVWDHVCVSHEVDTLIQRIFVSNIFNMCECEQKCVCVCGKFWKFIVFKSECFCELWKVELFLSKGSCKGFWMEGFQTNSFWLIHFSPFKLVACKGWRFCKRAIRLNMLLDMICWLSWKLYISFFGVSIYLGTFNEVLQGLT